MQAGIRTPAEVIALVLEEAGIHNHRAAELSEFAAKRLTVALSSVSTPTARVVCQAVDGQLEWATVHLKEGKGGGGA